MTRLLEVSDPTPTTYWAILDPNGMYNGTAITATTTGLTLGYYFVRGAEIEAVVGNVTEPVALASDSAAWTEWGVIQVRSGILRVDFPAAITASQGPVWLYVMVPGTDLVFRQIEPAAIVGSDPYAAAETSTDVVAAELAALATFNRTGTNGNTGLQIGTETFDITTNANAEPIVQIDIPPGP